MRDDATRGRGAGEPAANGDIGGETPTQRRVRLARELFSRKRAELGNRLVACGIYGSVAHGAALPHSDLELIFVLDGESDGWDENVLLEGIPAECNFRSGPRLVKWARHVGPDWGIEADQYRHHLVLWDPGQFFDRLHAAAVDLPDAAFDSALAEGWWGAFEGRGKVLNGLLSGDPARTIWSGWDFAFAAAMRIALVQRRPYERGRTLWADAATRGFGMPTLLDALTHGALGQMEAAVEHVWQQMRDWGTPAGSAPLVVEP